MTEERKADREPISGRPDLLELQTRILSEVGEIISRELGAVGDEDDSIQELVIRSDVVLTELMKIQAALVVSMLLLPSEMVDVISDRMARSLQDHIDELQQAARK